jgi:polysaccharide pyruvyl transferase WcaK-like protein
MYSNMYCDRKGEAATDWTYKKIGLLDHMGFGNMGDAAIQEAFIENIKSRLPNAILIAFSLNPDDTRNRHHIASYPIRWWTYSGPESSDPPAAAVLTVRSRLKTFLRRCRPFFALAKPIHDCVQELAHLVRSYSVIKSLDLLIVSGGGQLGELWSDLPYNVFKFCLLARLSKTPVLIVGVGAGPLKHPWNKFFARSAVRLASYTSFRDVESQALIRTLGVQRKTNVCPDPVYALDFRDYVTDRPESRLAPRVGLNPMGFCDPRLWPRKDGAAYSRYLDKLAGFSSWIFARGYELEIFTSDIGVDHYAIEDLEKMLSVDPASGGTARVVCRPVNNLRELVLQMSTFDYVVTSKFHGVVFSHLLRKPVIALSYHHKINDLMRTVGHDRYCLDAEHFELRRLIETFESLIDDSDDLRLRFRRVAEAYRNATQVQFDDLFGKAAVVNWVQSRERRVYSP